MNKDLIEMQKGCNATCVIINDNNYKNLINGISMDARFPDEKLYAVPFGNTPFKEFLDKKSKEKDITYFVIRNIDKVSSDKQDKYVGLVKDRNFHGYNIPDNVIIVFTIEDSSSLKNISSNLYHFAVVAI